MGGLLGMFDAGEMLAPGSGVARLEKLIVALEARVAELEKRLAAGFPQGVTTTTVSNGNGTACTNCLKGTGVETGVVISTMPPLYGMKCTACGHHWSKL